MTFSEYQQQAYMTALQSAKNVPYMALGLAGEAGEVANKVKKLIRDGYTKAREDELAKELGDVLWYAAGLATELGVSLDDVARDNLVKLRARQARGAIGGAGDNR